MNTSMNKLTIKINPFVACPNPVEIKGNRVSKLINKFERLSQSVAVENPKEKFSRVRQASHSAASPFKNGNAAFLNSNESKIPDLTGKTGLLPGSVCVTQNEGDDFKELQSIKCRVSYIQDEISKTSNGLTEKSAVAVSNVNALRGSVDKLMNLLISISEKHHLSTVEKNSANYESLKNDVEELTGKCKGLYRTIDNISLGNNQKKMGGAENKVAAAASDKLQSMQKGESITVSKDNEMQQIRNKIDEIKGKQIKLTKEFDDFIVENGFLYKEENQYYYFDESAMRLVDKLDDMFDKIGDNRELKNHRKIVYKMICSFFDEIDKVTKPGNRP